MTLKDWISETKQRFQNQPTKTALKNSAYELYLGGVRKAGPKIKYGDSIWADEWDVLVILDACRYDAFEETFENQYWYENLESMYSVGSTSAEWMQKTFDTEKYYSEIENTVYISGNPFTDSFVPKQQFQHLEEVWRHNWDEEHGTMMPQPLTDAAITAQREYSPDRLIIHYMQPHHPFVNYPLTEMDVENFGHSNHTSEFDMIRNGTLSEETVWKRYIDNLEFVIQHCQTELFPNISGKTVLTADHGELFGEYGLYEHGWNIPFPPVKKVPWAVCHCSDSEESNPNYQLTEPAEQEEIDENEVEERLDSLGYL